MMPPILMCGYSGCSCMARFTLIAYSLVYGVYEIAVCAHHFADEANDLLELGCDLQIKQERELA